jgi:Transposase DDE domain group 1
LVGRLFKRINLSAMVDPQYPVRGGIANSDILKCYLALLTLGKNDFEAVEGFRSQRFAHQALGLRAVPSCATLRQRFDAMGTDWSELADQINRAVLGLRIEGAPIDFGALSTGHLPLDIDTFVMDQSDTAKEGVSYTYAGVDGYCPIALYLGTRGYCLELDLRAGSQHSASESEYNIERALGTACAVTKAPLLLRADSGFCSQHLISRTLEQAATVGRQVDLDPSGTRARRRWRRSPPSAAPMPRQPGRNCERASASACGAKHLMPLRSKTAAAARCAASTV